MSAMHRSSPLLLCLLAVACTKPPDAPADLDELSGYLFNNVTTEDPAYLEAGVLNLDLWLEDNFGALAEGYTVRNLDQASVDALPGTDRDLDGLVGAAVAATSRHDVDGNVLGLTYHDQSEIFPEGYSAFEREYIDGNLQCFLDHECDAMVQRTWSTAVYPLGLTFSSVWTGEYRWVESDKGPVMVYRTFLDAPAELNFDWLEVEGQYFLGVSLPSDEGTLRLMSTWIVARIGDGGVNEAVALNLVISGLQDSVNTMDAWLDER